MNYLKQIKTLEKQLEELKIKESNRKARLKFLCICGRFHAIKDCDAIQTHFETYDGGYDKEWKQGEIIIICLITQIQNRILFAGNDMKENANIEYKFRWTYKNLFKSITERYENYLTGNWKNNYYFDGNRKKFLLE